MPLERAWQNPYAEPVIGSVRRECLHHVIVLGERHLRCILKEYFRYYNTVRSQLSLQRKAPMPKMVEPEGGRVIAIPHVGALDHH